MSGDELTPLQAVASAARMAAPVFEAMGWTYGGRQCDTPGAADLSLAISGLVRQAMEHEMVPDEHGIDEYWLASGRFVVTRRLEDGDDEITISLELAEFYVNTKAHS